MPIPFYIINMQGCEDRWETTLKRLTSLHLNAERFEATIGKNLSEQETLKWYCPKKNKKRYNRNQSAGEKSKPATPQGSRALGVYQLLTRRPALHQ